MNERLRKILKKWIIGLTLFFIALYIAFNSSIAQTKLTQSLGNYFGNKWNTTVSLDRIHLEPFQRLGIDNLYIQDLHGDTLLYAEKIYINFKRLNIFKGIYSIEDFKLDNARVFLRTYKGEDKLNFSFIIDSFEKDTQELDSTIVEQLFKTSIDELEIVNSHFIFQNQNVIDTSFGIHYSDLDVNKINGHFTHVSIVNDSIHFHIESLNATEKSGVVINNLESRGHINGKGFDFEPLMISMNDSRIDANRLAFKYGKWENFVDFITKVKMLGDFNLAKIKMNDISYFAPALEGWNQEFMLSGIISGRVNNLSGHDLTIMTGNETSFEGDFNMDGLPDIETTFITVEAKRLHSEVSDLENIQLYPFKEGKLIQLPESMKHGGEFTFKGDFTGFINDFVAFGRLESSRGNLISDLSLKQLENDSLLFSGSIASENLELGFLMGNTLFDKLDCNIEAKAYTHNGNFVSIELNGEVDKIGFNNYNYTNIELNGLLKPNYFFGKLTINDPALNMDFSGEINIKDNYLDLDFNTDLLYADLGALKILPIKNYSGLSGKIDLKFSGSEWTSLLGGMEVTNLEYCSDSATFNFGSIVLENDTLSKSKILILSSDLLSGEIQGNYELATVVDDILWEISTVIPSFIDYDSSYIPNQDFDFEFVFHDISFLRSLNIIDINVSSEAQLYGKVSPLKNQSYLNFNAEEFYFKGFTLNYPELFIESNGKDIFIELISDLIHYMDGPSYFIENEMVAIAINDTLLIDFEWSQVDRTKGIINLESAFLPHGEIEVSSNGSMFTFLDKKWSISDDGLVRFDSLKVNFNTVEIASETQKIRLNGEYATLSKDTLQLEVDNFELSNFNYMLQQFDYKVNGISNGYFHWIMEENSINLEADLRINNADFNDYFLGDINILSKKSSTDSSFHVEVSLLDEKLEKLKIVGNINPNSEDEMMDLTVDFNKFDLDVLNHTNIPGISDIKGNTIGSVNIAGSLKKPTLIGSLEIQNGGLFVDILGTHFTFDNKIDIYEDFIALDPFELYDKEGRKGIGYGTILHEHLKEWNYDFSLEIDNLLIMDLKNDVDALFYGKAYGTGNANIWGYNKLLFIDVVASTNKNTEIFIPIREKSSVEKIAFIEFINRDSMSVLNTYVKPIIDISGVEMNLEIDVNPNAEVQLIFDEDSGDILKVRSDGILQLIIDKENGFTMAGSLETYEGEYQFTFESILSKRFSIPTGSIVWLGDPYNANVDITAVYRTRASLAPIMIGESDLYKSRVNTNVYLELDGNLQSPDIAFDIELPDSDEKERTFLRSATSTTEDMNKQVVSLLLFNSFQSTSGWDESGGFASTNTFELLSNQVSSWLSQISDEVDVNVHYRPGTETSGQEVDVGLTTDILNERLTVTTQVGFKDQTLNPNPNTTANNIVGDFILEYKLTKDGRIRLKGFNKSNDNLNTSIYKQSPYTQGIGIVFRKDFDGNLKRKHSDKEKLQKKYEEEDKDTKDVEKEN